MISLVSFIDGGLKFFMLLIGYENVGFEFILGKFFIPISWMLGVEWKECESVGHVIASKTLVNEIVAFKLLGDYKSSGKISVCATIFDCD
jgi:pyrimidine nucleoside transport protein